MAGDAERILPQESVLVSVSVHKEDGKAERKGLSDYAGNTQAVCPEGE